MECLDRWQRMQWYAPSHGVTTAGNGCSGMQRLSVSRQLVMEQWNGLDSRSSEVSVLISGRLRRMVSEVFGKHFGGVYSWSTMSSSFVSPSVASLSHCESFHCSCICMAQVPCLVTLVFVCASFHPHVIHVCLTADWHLDCARSTHPGYPHLTW